ncbi:MAG: hypothetical protein HOW97_17050 [Catenulispora sp.]|nr:hypothetical protein [Catenulispora sp.]
MTRTGGVEQTRRVCKTRFKERGPKQWYVLDDGHAPWWLASNIDDAKDEFLLAWHGWRRPFGFVDGDGMRPIYGKDGKRCERAVILAEIKTAYRNERRRERG